MKKILALILIACALCVAIQARAEEVPFRETLAIAAGTGTFTYDEAVVKPYAEAIKVEVVLTPSTATTTNTITLISGTTTNDVATKVAAAGDNDTSLTAGFWLFRDDKVTITSTDTNAFTATLIGVEK
jgi:hypothetical protein